MSMVTGRVKSSRGFYIGDICYVLSNRIYHGLWGDRLGFKNGVIAVDERAGSDGEPLSFVVGNTSYGDGVYYDSEGAEYPVDAANIGLVPLELVDDESGLGFGTVVECTGEAEYRNEDGVIDINLPGMYIHIDTR